MSITAHTISPRRLFFARLGATPHRVLFLDYDGTLAPFVADRERAFPIPALLDTIEKVHALGTRVVVATGRIAADVRRLTGPTASFEIWGSHGFERLFPNGEYRTGHCSERLEENIARAHEALVFEGLRRQVEVKPCGIAVHWRGLARQHVQEVAAVAERILSRLTDFDAFLAHFDGGLELRARGYDKGHVVRTVMAESPGETLAAFVGDDLADEDGFRAVRPHGIGVLVRELHRSTAAELWLPSPAALEKFLEEWCVVTGANRRC